MSGIGEFLARAVLRAGVRLAMSFLVAMHERPLKGPPSAAAEAPTAPAAPIPAE
jgi:hypothetical protein